MIHPIAVVVPGEPVAQGRPRLTTRGGRARAYDPPRSVAWKAAAEIPMRLALGRRKTPDVPLGLSVDCYFSRPKTLKGAGKVPRAKRPDIDNLTKSVLDAGNGILWRDDALVVELTVRKWYARAGESPRVELVVYPVEMPQERRSPSNRGRDTSLAELSPSVAVERG